MGHYQSASEELQALFKDSNPAEAHAFLELLARASSLAVTMSAEMWVRRQKLYVSGAEVTPCEDDVALLVALDEAKLPQEMDGAGKIGSLVKWLWSWADTVWKAKIQEAVLAGKLEGIPCDSVKDVLKLIDQLDEMLTFVTGDSNSALVEVQTWLRAAIAPPLAGHVSEEVREALGRHPEYLRCRSRLGRCLVA
jgi:hypothetical protein